MARPVELELNVNQRARSRRLIAILRSAFAGHPRTLTLINAFSEGSIYAPHTQTVVHFHWSDFTCVEFTTNVPKTSQTSHKFMQTQLGRKSWFQFVVEKRVKTNCQKHHIHPGKWSCNFLSSEMHSIAQASRPSRQQCSCELFHFRRIRVDSNHSDSKPRATMRSKW